MTMISSLPSLPAAGPRWSPNLPEPKTADENAFASLLTEPASTNEGDQAGPNLVPRQSASPSASPSPSPSQGQTTNTPPASVEDAVLRQAMAEVFNAHGFFASAVSNTDPREDCKAHSDLAVAHPGEPSPGNDFVDDIGQATSGQYVPSFGGSSAIAAEFQFDNGAVVRPQARALPRGGAIMTWLGSATPISQASDESESQSIKNSKVGLRQTFAANAAANADLLIFQFGGQVVQFTGRMQALSKDERDQLFTRLNALLESHGLGLGGATLNGQPLTNAILRSSH